MCLLLFYEAFFCQTLFQTVDFVIKFKNYQNVLKYQLHYTYFYHGMIISLIMKKFVCFVILLNEYPKDYFHAM